MKTLIYLPPKTSAFTISTESRFMVSSNNFQSSGEDFVFEEE